MQNTLLLYLGFGVGSVINLFLAHWIVIDHFCPNPDETNWWCVIFNLLTWGVLWGLELGLPMLVVKLIEERSRKTRKS
jgi:hypothetical protein